MEKHTNGSASHPLEIPPGVLCAILCRFDGAVEKTVEELCEAVSPGVTLQQRLAAFHDSVKNYPGFKQEFATQEQQAHFGLQKVVLAALSEFQAEGAVTFKLAPDLHRVASVVLTPKRSPTLRQSSRTLRAHMDRAWRAGEARLADGKEVWEPSLRQTLWAAVDVMWEPFVRRGIVDGVLERFFRSAQYRTVCKGGFAHLRLKSSTKHASRRRARS
jgi:hypothetical protein